ncbi:MAG TPA: thioredoxin family protein [Trebonia sp.]|jgi:thiol-disulfide isomerase/thioredoxin|nr:thioredoxin family protein [Trebonia sp.]
MGGLIVLVVVLAAASGFGLVLRRRQGKFKVAAPAVAGDDAREPRGDILTATDLGGPLGARATLVQFSTGFCANCPPTRRMLGQVAAEYPGVELVEVDAAARLDLARRLNVLATPTVLVLGPDGAIVSRASGQPRRPDVLAAVGGVLAGSMAGSDPADSDIRANG